MSMPKLIVFDMDGVLVDVSASYRPAIAATVRDYFSLVLGLPQAPDDLVSPEDLELLKKAGGLNNDWDMAAATIAYLLTLLPEVPVPPSIDEGGDTGAILSVLRSAASTIAVDWPSVLGRKNFAALSQAVAEQGGGLGGVQRSAGPRNRALLSYRGTLRDSDLVTRLFQENYLGSDLFAARYGEATRFVQEAGLCREERLMVTPETLARLAERYPLGIATGRPGAEALFALDHFGVRNLFRVVVSDDEVLEAEERAFRDTGQRPGLRKPHPHILLAALDALGDADQPGIYVGDVPDDIRTAHAANLVRPVLAVGCCAAAQYRIAMRQAFLEAGADRVVEDLEELAHWLLE